VSDDEVAVLLLSGIAAVIGWAVWYRRILAPRALRPRGPAVALLGWTPVACLGVLLTVLRTAASHDVRDAPQYILLYALMGAAWVVVSSGFFSHTGGVSMRDDVAERGNVAAAVAVAGGLVGVTLCFAGGNIGDGPGWWVVVFCALFSTSALLLLWAISQRLTRSFDVITIDRDLGTATRTALMLVACGLILGRAVAGDWHSAAATVTDFARVGWPSAGLVAFDAWLAHGSGPRADAPETSIVREGLAPGAFYLAAAAAWLLWRGPW
jgi:uncharacterized membrane protein YjfL (UPF0719 family)